LTQPSFFSVTPVWNNVESIFDCLTALDKFVDELVVCEGKWNGYEGELRSTDGTLDEIVRFIKTAKHHVTFMMLPKPMNQVDVRNLMIDIVPSQSWFIVMDSDEIVEKYPEPDKIKELLKSNSKGFCIRSRDIVEIQTQGHLLDLPSIWRKVDGLHYTRNHRYLDVYSTPVIYNTTDFPACYDFLFLHNGQFKKTRKQAEAYKNWLVNWEYEDKPKGL
jgi:hypothetical protein